jgi:uncharacterized sulfatase
MGYEDLFDMAADPAESYSVAARHPEVVAEMKARIARARQEFGPLKRGMPDSFKALMQALPHQD